MKKCIILLNVVLFSFFLTNCTEEEGTPIKSRPPQTETPKNDQNNNGGSDNDDNNDNTPPQTTGDGKNQLGIWLWYIEGTGYNHAQLAQKIADIGIRRVYIKVGDGGINANNWPEVVDTSLVQTYKDAGLEVWAWAYNYPGNDSKQAEVLYTAAQTGYEGFVTDIEIEFDEKSTELHNIFTAFRSALNDAKEDGYATDDFKLYCTTWGNPKDHKMRVDIIDQYVDGHMPQTYLEVWGDTYMSNATYWVNVGTEEYQELGCEKPVHHIISAEYDQISVDQINEVISASGAQTSLWRIPGEGTPLSIWNTIEKVNWSVDFE
ncbi:hypothetical protein [Sediminitomix flava]|uniref:Glycosyl hydrolase family 25 n=1 Tax=Sediminitomix flava TaxID=379075 RepID=A0A315ZD73_SEDFL|nr:hypothetical protein [Sediminitomix flava]PWJ43252.1 hypothetical protein BC781_102801 [Sediminitomix flava]